MRFVNLALLVFLVVISGLVACNSNETTLSQTPKTLSDPKLPQPAPTDNARRISVAEAHDHWQKGDAIVIDTRPEAAYKEEHIKGAISMPTGTVLSRVSELPRNKLIIAYCT